MVIYYIFPSNTHDNILEDFISPYIIYVSNRKTVIAICLMSERRKKTLGMAINKPSI